MTSKAPAEIIKLRYKPEEPKEPQVQSGGNFLMQ